MNLAGYIRVSSEVQVDAYGKPVQRAALQRWAELNDHAVTEWFEEDAVSGKTDGEHRPALSEILERANEFDGVVFFDSTRIARLYVVQETLLALLWGVGLKVFTTTAGEMSADEDDPTKILIRQILAIIAEFDHRSIVKKLTAAKKLKAAGGGYIGGTPKFGFRVIGSGKSAEFVTDELEFRVVEEIRLRHGVGESMRSIAASLNRREIPTKRSKQWTPVQVSRIIQRHVNASQTQGK